MSTHRTFRRLAVAAAGVVALAFAGAAAAQTRNQTQPQAQQQTPAPPSAQGAATHPRRAEVNARLHEQGHEIHQQVKSGAMSKEEGKQLHAQDHAIHREEHAMVKSNGGGDLTAPQQQKLNQQADKVAQQIKK
jgi:hypothetical protein